jgi:hypothetical protein
MPALNQVIETKAVCLSSDAAVGKEKGTKYCINKFLTEADGVVDLIGFGDLATALPAKHISSFEDIVSGKVKSGVLKFEAKIKWGKPQLVMAAFEVN